MDDLCGSKFWDWDVSWYTDDPDLTPCFQKTVLLWVPDGFLWISSIFMFIFLRPCSKGSLPWSVFSVLKILLCLLLMLDQLVKLSTEVGLELRRFIVYSVDLYNPVLEIVTYGLAIATTIFCKNVGIRSSSILFIFWLLKTVCAAVPFRTAIRNHSSLKENSDIIFYLAEIISFPLILAQFLLNCWADSSLDFRRTSKGKSCPRSTSSALSRLVFSWLDSLAWKGSKKPLGTSDLWDLDPHLTTASLVKSFDEHWARKLKNNAEDGAKRGKRPLPVSIISVLFSSFGNYFMLGAALKLIPDLLAFVSPQILNLLIVFVNGGEERWKGYFYAILLILTDFMVTLGRNHHVKSMFLVSFRVKSALMSAVYRKALVLSNATRRERTVGEIVNLMSVDVTKLSDVMVVIHFLWTGPLQIAIALYFLWAIIGPSALAGLAVMMLIIPLNAFVSSKLREYQVAQMKKKDERIKLISEILSGIKILKLYAWEPSFQNEVLKIREKEMSSLKSAAYASAFNDFMWACSTFLVTLATFASFVFLDEKNVLDARTAFVSLALMNVMNLPLTAFPMVIIRTIQAAVSLRRLNKFMNSDEIDFDAVTHHLGEVDPIVIKNGSFAWNGKEETILEDVNVRIKKGSLVGVVGAVGSGKSSLLSAILGEMEIISGSVNTIGNISYASQIPWIQNGTLRENVLFGKTFEARKYNKAIKACCLEPDLDSFGGRDQIEIGEKGINLSGGQKQRVSVARAIYNRAELFLFDDPLSSVDAHVGKAMFENVFGPNGILKKKTRILVTHSVTFLPQMDQIIVLENGRVSEIGSYEELLEKKAGFSSFLAQYSQSENHEAEDNMAAVFEQKSNYRLHSVSECSDLSGDFDPARSPSPMDGLASCSSLPENEPVIPEAQKLIGEEFKETTKVPWRLYFQYFQAAGWTWVTVSFLGYILFQVFAILANVWLSVWSEKEVVNGTQLSQGYNVGVYAGLGVIQSAMFVFASVLMCLANLRSAFVYHNKMLCSVLQAPMWFFDTTPKGRILNRFSKDVDVLDTGLSLVLRASFRALIDVFGTMILIAWNLPIFIVVILPQTVFYYVVQKLSIPTSRQLKRLESVTRSPIYSNFSETISGATTIRAYGQRERFLSEVQAKIDSNQACSFPSIILTRWSAVRLECIGSFAVFFTAIFSVMYMDTLSPGTVGLSLTYALRMSFVLGFLVRHFCDVETNIVAVERLQEYCEIPKEAEWESVRKPAKSWPSSGKVRFENYQTKYREGLDLVLKNISFEIQGGEKVGVVGRTGAGKSSLTLALFRLIEGTDGNIIIDGENISGIGLHDLRRNLTIIPQDPVLFSGTLRFNLDPFDNYSDNEIWNALKLSHLNQFVASLPTQLSHPIGEGGDNLSVGQKQLVCLVRALLRKSKILVLDEATASIDLETDDLIQETIRSEFKDSTVITIAHRLNTIMDSTRILVLDQGLIKEYDTPGNLLRDPASQFYQMAKDAGLMYS